MAGSELMRHLRYGLENSYLDDDLVHFTDTFGGLTSVSQRFELLNFSFAFAVVIFFPPSSVKVPALPPVYCRRAISNKLTNTTDDERFTCKSGAHNAFEKRSGGWGHIFKTKSSLFLRDVRSKR